VHVLLRAVFSPILAVTMGVYWLAGPATADPPPTQVINAVAVGPNGQPINGYQEAPQGGNLPAVNDCTPSPSAVADNIYSCSPAVTDAGTCWPSTRGTLLCVDNPWDKRLNRVAYGGQLPPVQHPATPDPFALVLEDGTRCTLRHGGAWGGRDDGYVGVYGCDSANPNMSVLWLPSQGAGSCIDRSTPVWTVKVGQLGAANPHFPPPETRAVTTVWFAGD
jgi:hypothetical protein